MKTATPDQRTEQSASIQHPTPSTGVRRPRGVGSTDTGALWEPAERRRARLSKLVTGVRLVNVPSSWNFSELHRVGRTARV